MTLTAEQQRKVDALVERLAILAATDHRSYVAQVADALACLAWTIESQHDDNDRLVAWNDCLHYVKARAWDDYVKTIGCEP